MAKTEQVTLEQAMSGILALLAVARDDAAFPDRKSEDRRKTEVILADVGLTPAQIGQLLAKKPKTVSATIIRSRGKSAEGGEDA